jgi:ABC-type phosphate transport system substrate-binding protein
MKTFLLSIFSILISILSINDIKAQNSFIIIANKNNTVTSLSKKEISDLFLKKKTKWADGTTVAPVDLNANSKTREDFSQQIHGKGTSAIRSFWQQAAFSGTASAPPEKASDAEVIDFVKKNPGAIGYVPASANTDGVKTISTN